MALPGRSRKLGTLHRFRVTRADAVLFASFLLLLTVTLTCMWLLSVFVR